jgi:hypothetical protein
MKVQRVIPHPMYNMGVAHDNDVALFQVCMSKNERCTLHRSSSTFLFNKLVITMDMEATVLVT